MLRITKLRSLYIGYIIVFCEVTFTCVNCEEKSYFRMTEEMKQSSDSGTKFCRPESSNDDPSKIDNDPCLNFKSDPSQKQKRYDAVTNSENLEGKKRKIMSPYSQREALVVAENLRNESTFNEALSTLKSWLERGECTKETASNFFSLFQSVIAHVNSVQQKVENDKKKINKMECDLMRSTQDFLVESNIVKEILNSAEEQKVRDHFTKAERDDIEKFRNDIETYHKKAIEDLASYGNCNISEDNEIVTHQENETVTHQENETVRHKEIEKLFEEKRKLSSQLAAIQKVKDKLDSQLATVKGVNKNLEEIRKSTANVSSFSSEDQVRLIAIIAPFLNSHAKIGSSAVCISSYLKNFDFNIGEQEIENFLTRFPSVFKKLVSEEGTNTESKWTFCGYE